MALLLSGQSTILVVIKWSLLLLPGLDIYYPTYLLLLPIAFSMDVTMNVYCLSTMDIVLVMIRVENGTKTDGNMIYHFRFRLSRRNRSEERRVGKECRL